MTSRTVRSRTLIQAIGLLGFSVIVSGCFQTAGAQIQATMTPIGGIVVAQASFTPAPLNGTDSLALTSAALTGTAQIAPPTQTTLIAAVPTSSETATVQQLVFTTPTGPATGSPLPSLTASATNTDQPTATFPSPTPLTYTPTVTATVPTITPSATIPSPTPSPSATEPPITTPTASGTSAIVALQGTVVALEGTTAGFTNLVATPSGTSQIAALQGTIVALQGTTAGFSAAGATETQDALNLQATGIIDTATAGAAQQLTLAATLLGTGAPAQPTQAIQPLASATASNGIVAVTETPTLATTPTITDAGAVAGAMGTIDGSCRYTVVDGDRLFRIALRFNMSTYQVAYPNRLINPDLIVPGEVILIPGCNGNATVAPGTGAASSTSNGTLNGSTYMVVDGDTLYGIATRYNVRVIALAQANGLTNINLIYIGQNLTIPGH